MGTEFSLEGKGRLTLVAPVGLPIHVDLWMKREVGRQEREGGRGGRRGRGGEEEEGERGEEEEEGGGRNGEGREKI